MPNAVGYRNERGVENKDHKMGRQGIVHSSSVLKDVRFLNHLQVNVGGLFFRNEKEKEM